MLPATYQLPAALVLVLCGIVACFFGYRLFRIVLATAGFILGALIASSVWGVSDTVPMLVAAGVGGLIGAGVMFAGYFVGVALVGAALGAVAASLAYQLADKEPHVLAVVFCSIIGAVGSTYLQRYFLIVGTGFIGAWTLIVGAMAAIGNRAGLAAAAASGSVWVPYPLDPAPGQKWVPIAWGVLGLLGTAVQLGWTGGEKGRVGRRKKKT
jgi:Domain of unknown function (DUF4203)